MPPTAIWAAVQKINLAAHPAEIAMCDIRFLLKLRVGRFR
jgi:hypothetical protein